MPVDSKSFVHFVFNFGQKRTAWYKVKMNGFGWGGVAGYSFTFSPDCEVGLGDYYTYSPFHLVLCYIVNFKVLCDFEESE